MTRSLTGFERAKHDDRLAAAAAAAAVPGATRGPRYGRDHSMAVGRGKRIGTLLSAGALVLVVVAFAVAMMSQGGDADLKPAAAANSPGVLQSSGATVEHGKGDAAGPGRAGAGSQDGRHGGSRDRSARKP